MHDDIAKNRHVLFAVLRHAVFLARSPPLDSLQSVAAFRGAERVMRKLVEFYAVTELIVQLLMDIEGAQAQAIDRRVGAQNFEVKAVAIKRDDVREGFQFRDESLRIALEPTPEAMFFVPCHSHGDAECPNVSPAARDFVRKPQRLDIQINLAIE